MKFSFEISDETLQRLAEKTNPEMTIRATLDCDPDAIRDAVNNSISEAF